MAQNISKKWAKFARVAGPLMLLVLICENVYNKLVLSSVMLMKCHIYEISVYTVKS